MFKVVECKSKKKYDFHSICVFVCVIANTYNSIVKNAKYVYFKLLPEIISMTQ